MRGSGTSESDLERERGGEARRRQARRGAAQKDHVWLWSQRGQERKDRKEG